jgi:uncharacterized membrane protein YgcG
MKRAKLLSAAFLSIAVASVVTGCHGGPVSDTDVAVVSDYAVIVDKPLVKIDGDVTAISGTIHRVPGNSDAITGRLDIDFVAPDGDVLDWIPCGFNPRKVPTDPSATATYEIRYGVVFPKDTVVRVKFLDSASAEREDADNAGPGGTSGAGGGYGGGGGHGGGHGHGGGGGGVGGKTW